MIYVLSDTRKKLSVSRKGDKYRPKRCLLFPGGNQYQRFMSASNKMIYKNRQEFID